MTYTLIVQNLLSRTALSTSNSLRTMTELRDRMNREFARYTGSDAPDGPDEQSTFVVLDQFGAECEQYA